MATWYACVASLHTENVDFGLGGLAQAIHDSLMAARQTWATGSLLHHRGGRCAPEMAHTPSPTLVPALPRTLRRGVRKLRRVAAPPLFEVAHGHVVDFQFIQLPQICLARDSWPAEVCMTRTHPLTSLVHNTHL